MHVTYLYVFINAYSDGLNSKFDARIHMDYLRGTRENSSSVSSASLLRPLITHGLKISMYLTPMMQGWRKLFFPPRVNEVFGLSHLKVAVFDNTVLITGANLSHSYFIDRTDRYACIDGHPDLSDYYWSLLEQLESISYTLVESPCANLTSISTKEYPLKFIPPKINTTSAQNLLEAFIEQQITKASQKFSMKSGPDASSTYLIPSLQMVVLIFYTPAMYVCMYVCMYVNNMYIKIQCTLKREITCMNSAQAYIHTYRRYVYCIHINSSCE